MNAYLEVVLRTLLAIAVLLVLARLNGAKQISQLTFYDYIVGISAGSIAASMCIELDINLWFCLIAMTIFMLSSLVLSLLTSKSIMMRRMLTGSPVFLIDQGKILYDGLKRTHMDVNDMLRELRVMGYFDPAEVNYAIMETNGNLSVMPKVAERPAKTSEQGMTLPEDGLKANVIIDGKFMHGNLKAMDKTVEWVQNEVERQQAGPLSDIALATLDEEGSLSIYKKEKSPSKHNILQ